MSWRNLTTVTFFTLFMTHAWGQRKVANYHYSFMPSWENPLRPSCFSPPLFRSAPPSSSQLLWLFRPSSSLLLSFTFWVGHFTSRTPPCPVREGSFTPAVPASALKWQWQHEGSYSIKYCDYYFLQKDQQLLFVYDDKLVSGMNIPGNTYVQNWCERVLSTVRGDTF